MPSVASRVGSSGCLITPTHHRVHHGVNPKYIDKNYGGMFIVWDRLLGTFQEEEDEPVYGTVKPLASFNPLWANVHYWVEMGQMAARAGALADKLRIWWMPPEWRPRDLSGGLGYVTIPEADRASRSKYDAARITLGLIAYIAIHFALRRRQRDGNAFSTRSRCRSCSLPWRQR